MTPFFTVGHSDRSLGAFIDLILGAGIVHVADIRKMPMSRANPQFNRDVLAEALPRHGIGYEHVASLGGLRGRDRRVPPCSICGACLYSWRKNRSDCARQERPA